MVWKLTDEDHEAVLAVHAGDTFRFTRTVVPHFRRQAGGQIIKVISYTGLPGNLGQPNYAMAKAGVIGFTRTTAKELARFGVTVNAISPNAQTRMLSGIPQQRLAELAAAIPMSRFAEPSEMAAAIAFPGVRRAAYAAGAVSPVHGNISI
jgi:3-oxoacyl-[acyl-carrier protein] reductase